MKFGILVVVSVCALVFTGRSVLADPPIVASQAGAFEPQELAVVGLGLLAITRLYRARN